MRENVWVFVCAICLPFVYLGWQFASNDYSQGLDFYLQEHFDDLWETRWQDVFVASWEWFSSLRIVFLFLFVPAFLLWIDRCIKRKRSLVTPMAATAILMFICWLPSEIVRHLPALNPSEIGAHPSSFAQWVYLGLVMTSLSILPFSAWLIRRVSVLDRYVTVSFLAPLGVCLAAFIGIWLINDFSDNSAEFSQGEAELFTVLQFYLHQFPQIFVTLLPISCLLAVLYTLARMSRHNEIVAMLSSGRGLVRILMPMFVVAGLLAFVSLTLNFRLAPHALAQKEAAIEAISDQEKSKRMHRYLFTDRVYVDSETKRIWFIGRYPADYRPGESLRFVYVVQLDETNRARRAIYSDNVKWHPIKDASNTHKSYWRFDRATVWERQKDNRFVLQGYGSGRNAFYAFDWPENPYLLGTAGLRASDASIPEILTYLRSANQLKPEEKREWMLTMHSLIANSFTCFVVVLFAAPLGVVIGRRGVLTGVTFSAIAFFGQMFCSGLLGALGSSGALPPMIAAWGTNLLLLFLGISLLYLRQKNRELPNWKVGKVLKSLDSEPKRA